MHPLHEARRRMNTALMQRVAGPDPAAAQHRIHATPGPRWFEPDSPIGVVHGDASMYIGGIRALLLQALHPLAMAGVAQHSRYRDDVWGRLARTATYIATTTYATIEHAEQAIAIVQAVHARIRGIAPDGRPYRADDPHLLTWVHIAEIDSFLTAHRLFGARRLSPAQQDVYVRQAGTVATRLGATEVPSNVAELTGALNRYRPELAVTPEAREVAAFLLHRPPVPAVARPGYALLARGAVVSLPDWARVQLQLPRPVRRSSLLAGRAGTAAVRWITTAAPRHTPDPTNHTTAEEIR
ncbi:oxygenase MpaB family protein [Ruania rhizosphaerae]|uniref:oxygenase MpaB family protein n=1 Tax=Ruania rhizosphaerae TaxID=1840413 RepID=UPI001F3EDFF2|nr:oxygenase MpaB family protein [Ruania rhizosphaerae]